MKIKSAIVIDATIDVVWRACKHPQHGPSWLQHFTMTEEREPDFSAGNYAANSTSAIIVNHFEKMGDAQTRWVTYWNFSFKGLKRFTAAFRQDAILRKINDDMQHVKLIVETGVAK